MEEILRNLELHYYFKDESHSMNAIVKNKSEAELLKLLTEISQLLDLDVELEFEALREGGIKDIVKFFTKKKHKNKRNQLLIYFGAIVSGVLINVITGSLTKDTELESLTKIEKKLNIRHLTNIIEKDSLDSIEKANTLQYIIFQISNTHKVKVFKSRFYQNILKEEKIDRFSTIELDENYVPLSVEQIIERNDFKNQVLENEDLKPIINDNANIEIVSPVLKKGNIKWKGIYDEKPISFNLQDTDFKNAVLNREYSFSNGTTIKCKLEIIITIDENGVEVIKEAKVLDVFEIFDSVQTYEIKKAKPIKELKNQMNITFNK